MNENCNQQLITMVGVMAFSTIEPLLFTKIVLKENL